ncbi:MAG: hypothetical protein JJT75_12865 [Opitutales bacterium]|nr:hypothetical protein [Opitutales bacterium]MCH8540463.1 hypothetical protein [Opitutales bacterium]
MKNSWEPEWPFPLPRTHTGVLLGNGTLGISLWGGQNVLRLTVGRNDFWDHRGGKPWVEGMSYPQIRRLLEKQDEEGLRNLFERGEYREGEPEEPTILPIGRWEAHFPDDLVWDRAVLLLQEGTLRVDGHWRGTAVRGTLRVSMKTPELFIEFDHHTPRGQWREVPSATLLGAKWEKRSLAQPVTWKAEKARGWVQSRPKDPPLGVALAESPEGQMVGVTALIAETEKSVREKSLERVRQLVAEGPQDRQRLVEDNLAWWKAFWERTPDLEMPHKELQFLYRYGMFKFGAMTNPSAAPAGLQGPWIEDFQFPPWSSDYHFNINIQLCYMPAYRGNHGEHLLPLFRLIESWLPKLRENARIFVGIDDGVMLPHAVDDRGTCMGGFWTGSIDHGCTAWVADMMYQYYLYSDDQEFLAKVAYPFLHGSFRVYEEMLEIGPDGKWGLPVSVSPEYRASAMNAWGKNASFQLACIHRLLENLKNASVVLGKSFPVKWSEIASALPKACLVGPEGKKEIGLWEGTPLEESHRHPSHLMGLFPFNVIDGDAPEWQKIDQRSINRWIEKGMGLWSGWCIPLAAILHARRGNAEMAELLLEIWQKVFTNEGHGTLHDYTFPGFTMIGAPPRDEGLEQPPERMQMDAGMGVTAALMEFFVHRVGKRYKLFGGIPHSWETTSFKSIALEGGFYLSGEKKSGRIRKITVRATRRGKILLESPWSSGPLVFLYGQRVKKSEKYLLHRTSHKAPDGILEITLGAGEEITLCPVERSVRDSYDSV